MATKRAFIAIDISIEARAVCAAHADRLRRESRDVRVGWEKPEKLHLTLKFLGDTDSAALTGLATGVESVANRTARFDLRLGRTGVFPSSSRPRILWIGVEDPANSTGQLQKAVEDFCSTIGFERERRAFRPHLTIARIREPARAERLAGEHLRTQIEPVQFTVSEIVIYESTLLKAGSVYNAISRLRLKG